MLVSVIMPCYNAKYHIFDSVDSVLNQDYQDIELLIVDDQSNDGTYELLTERYSDNDKVVLLRNNNIKGAGGARSFGLEKSSGRFIAFLDSDDLWVENKISQQIDFMYNKGLCFTYTHYSIFNEYKNLGIRYAASKATFNSLLSHCTIGNSTVIIDKEYFTSLPEYPILPKEDYAFWLKITSLGYEGHLCPIIGTKYRVSDGSISGNKFKEIPRQYNVLRKVAGLGFLKSSYFVSKYIFLGIFVRLRLKFGF